MSFKRSDWNAVLDDVNAIITNPPSGCSPRPALEHVGPKTIWKKSHIRQVQDAIKATCDEIEFDEIPERWEQSIIDDIREQLGRAWCNCDGDEPCTPQNVRDEDGTVFAIYSNGPGIVKSECLHTNFPAVPLGDLISGLQVGRAGIFDRRWEVHRTSNLTGLKVRVTSGVINCKGLVVYDDTLTIPFSGIFVFCSDCGSAGCAKALAEAAVELNPENYQNYTLEIDSLHASCALPGECP